ncbi:MAG: hypothetical protein R3F37_22110 [Candidatus Competibacteraceae bacterium]
MHSFYSKKIAALVIAMTGFSLFSPQGYTKEVPKSGEPALNITLNGELKATLVAEKQNHVLRGRVSAHLRATESDLKQGIVTVQGMNIVYYGVPQAAITGKKPRYKETGVLGYMLDRDLGQQVLKYDPKSGRLEGELSGQVDLPQFAELDASWRKQRDHDFTTLTQAAALGVNLQLKDPEALYAGQKNVETREGELSLQLEALPLPELQIGPYGVYVEFISVHIEVTWLHYIEAAQRLCLQPVRIATQDGAIHYSGDGLAFGMPSANAEWGKADVVFTVRDWETIWDGSYSTFGEAEAEDLLAEVDVDDCIEIFFVDDMTAATRSGWGGGATFGVVRRRRRSFPAMRMPILASISPTWPMKSVTY